MKRKVAATVLLITVMLSTPCLLFKSIDNKSATYDEAMYLVTGYSILKTGDYRLTMEKPPLSAAILALPLTLLNLDFLKTEADISDWENSKMWINLTKMRNSIYDYRWRLGLNFLYRNKSDADTMLKYSRTANIFFYVLLGISIFTITAKMSGSAAGLAAYLLYCFCPIILSNSQLATTDIIVSFFIFLHVFYFYRTLEKSGLVYPLLAGTTLALALASKQSALYLLPIDLIIFVIFAVNGRVDLKGLKNLFTKAALIAFSAVFFIALVYKFVYFPYFFKNTRNILQVKDFGQATFLLGKYSYTGFWNYYIILFVVKTTLPVLLLTLFSAVFYLKLDRENKFRLATLAAPVIVIFYVCSASKIQLGTRYLLPIYPFLFSICGMTAGAALKRNRFYIFPAVFVMVWQAYCGIRIYPDYLAYFNELAGGPDNGYRILSDSNIDWGQDLKGLKEYVRKNNVSDSVLSYYGASVPEYLDFKFQDLFSFGVWGEKSHINSLNPSKEILAVSATNLDGVYLGKIGTDYFRWLNGIKPDAKIGYSIFVYDITSKAFFHEWLAHSYFMVGDYEKSSREAKRAVMIDNTSLLGHLMLGLIYSAEQKNERALAEFNYLKKADPGLNIPFDKLITNTLSRQAYYNGLMNLGNVLQRNGIKNESGLFFGYAKQLSENQGM